MIYNLKQVIYFMDTTTLIMYSHFSHTLNVIHHFEFHVLAVQVQGSNNMDVFIL